MEDKNRSDFELAIFVDPYGVIRTQLIADAERQRAAFDFYQKILFDVCALDSAIRRKLESEVTTCQ